MSDNNYQEAIKNNKLFDGIPPENLEIPFNGEQIIKKKEGEIIFQKGDASKSTFLILSGKVKVKVYIENKSVKLNKISKDFFGDIEVLEDTYRRSAAVANTDCVLYSLSKTDLRTFLANNPEVNDNIIAYNKVDIPELLITIHPSLFSKDTDKLYVSAVPEAIPETEDTENEEKLVDDDNLAEDEISAIPEENSEYADDVLDEPEFESSIEDLTEEPNETIPNDASEFQETLSESPEEVNVESENNDELLSEENEEVNQEESILTEEDIDLPDELSIENESEIKETAEDEIISIDEINTDAINEEIDITNSEQFVSTESDHLISDEMKNEPAEKKIEEKPETEFSADPLLDSDEEERSPWHNLTTEEREKDILSGMTEEEQIRYEAEQEKLKYDDTELNSARILNAVLKINSSLDEQVLHANIVREAVKLTEAQAGTLYILDNLKNLLVTEMQTEDGYVEVRFPAGSGLTGLAAETGEIINVREPIKDFRFSEDIDSIQGIVSSSLICIPISNDEKETIAVLCLANSSSGKFLLSDEETILSLVPHISQTLLRLANFHDILDKSKNTYLSTFTKFVTENIQTPVLTMKYYAAQIRKKNIPSEIKTILNVLMDQADSVVNFLHSSLAYTENTNPLEIEEYELQEVIDSTLGLLAEYVESRNVALYKKVESNIRVKVDKKAFYQACLQIAKNACDSMGESGNIYITAKRSGDIINIEFRDTGPGIADEIKSQIFQPFKSFLKENGTGLGLTIAQKIIRDHGGELTVESSPGQGAIFTISLPSFDQI